MAGLSLLDGMSVPDLQSYLAALQKVYLELSAGKSVASAGYTQGDGSKNVSFRRTDMATVAITIRQLQQQLGMDAPRRRPLRPYF